MNKYYVGDTPLIKVDCVTNITNATVTKIRYIKPSGATDLWTADSVESDPHTGDGRYLLYQTNNSDIDEAGTWKFHAYVEFTGNKHHGEVATQEIFALGS